jgi:hypothetical protein
MGDEPCATRFGNGWGLMGLSLFRVSVCGVLFIRYPMEPQQSFPSLFVFFLRQLPRKLDPWVDFVLVHEVDSIQFLPAWFAKLAHGVVKRAGFRYSYFYRVEKRTGSVKGELQMMSGVSKPAGLTTTVELKGHLIDSLTLSKVIDLVQQLGGDYRLNDIRIGSLKKDISAISMTLIARDEQSLQQLLTAITPYGATPEENDAVNTLVCKQDGVCPEEAYQVKLPQRAHVGGNWKELSNGGTWVLALDGDHPVMKPVTELRQGDRLVSGTHGLQW